VSTSPAVLAAALIERSRNIGPTYQCCVCGMRTTQPSVTDASDFYPNGDGELEFQRKHYLCCPRCYSTNLEKLA
jgi:hypothetical protein